MDRDKAREGLTSITDNNLRQKETSRIEGSYHFDIAAAHLFASRKGKCPQKEELWRVVEAMQILIYDSGINSTPEEKARIDYANGVLNANLDRFLFLDKYLNPKRV